MRVKAILAVLRKDLIETRREKMVLFWIFVFPVMWLLLLGGIWGSESPPVTVDVGVVYANGGNVVGIMENATFEGSHLFDVTVYSSEMEGLKALKEGRIKALMVFPRGFEENLTTGKQAKIEVYFDKSDPQEYQIVRGIVVSFFSRLSKEIRERQLQYIPPGRYNLSAEEIMAYIKASGEPIALEERAVSREAPSPIKFYVISFMGIQFLFATMLSISGSVFEEMEKGTLRRVAASPATPWDFLVGKMLSTIITIGVSIFVGIGFAKVVFGETVFPSLFGWAFILTAATFSMGLGLAIGMSTGSARATNALVNLIAMPLLFLAGIVIPESVLPGWARPIVNYFPLGRALKDLRLLELYHRPPIELLPDLALLGLTALATLLFAVVLYGWRVKRLD